MGTRQSIGGRSSFSLYAVLIAILVLATLLVYVFLVIVPDRQRQREADIQHAQATATTEARTAEVQRAYGAGVAYSAAGDWDTAVEEFGKVVALEPNYGDAAARLSEARNQAVAAKATLAAHGAAAATAQAMSEIEAAYQRGLGYANLKRWDEAKAEFEKVLVLVPNYKEVQAKLVEVETQRDEARLPVSTATTLPSITPVPVAVIPTLTSTPNTMTRTVTVYANNSWNTTEMTVEAGDRILIEYLSGLWTYWPGTILPFDANGSSERYVCSEFLKAADCVEPLPQANKGSLVARIGSGGAIYVGNRSSFEATEGGSLELSMNDSRLPIDYSKNEGSIVVQITLTKS